MRSWNKAHQQLMSRQFSEGKLPHAILICGAHGAGKLSLAKWIVSIFNCQRPSQSKESILHACNECKTCLLSHSGTNPDTAGIEQVERSISVEDVRKLTQFLETKPQLAAGKSVFISESERLTESAANALLKTLEEPNDNSLIVLTCRDQESVLPTILSRCQLVMIRPLVGQALSEHANIEEIDPYININALTELTDPELKEQYMDFNTYMANFVQSGSITVELETSILNHQFGLDWLERYMINIVRKQNHWQVSNMLSEIKPELTLNTFWHIYQLVIQAKKKLKSLVQANQLFVKSN